MVADGVDRRSFLKTMGSAGLSTAFPAAAFGASPFSGAVVEEKAEPAQDAAVRPAYSVRFSVAGMSHDHIYGMVDAMIRGGGVLVSVYAAEPERWSGLPEALSASKVRARPRTKSSTTHPFQLVLSSLRPRNSAHRSESA